MQYIMEFSLFFKKNSEMGIRAIWSGGVKKEGKGGEGRWGEGVGVGVAKCAVAWRGKCL